MRHLRISACAGAVLLCAQAGAVTLNFDDLPPGIVLSGQYAAQGVLFVPNAFSGSGGPTGDWAANTDMRVVAVAGDDVGLLGTPPLAAGHLLRSFGGWLQEDGDPSFAIAFTTPVNSFSLDFAGVDAGPDVRLWVYDGPALLQTVQGPGGVAQFTLSASAASITRVVVGPGSSFDWVGVDNLRFAPVPEPTAALLLLAGLAGLCARSGVARCRMPAARAG